MESKNAYRPVSWSVFITNATVSAAKEAYDFTSWQAKFHLLYLSKTHKGSVTHSVLLVKKPAPSDKLPKALRSKPNKEATITQAGLVNG